MDSSSTLSSALREGRERLYPSLTNPNWLVLSQRRRIFSGWLAQLPTAGLAVLDIGGRIQPYRPLLGDGMREYVAVDLRQTPLVNVIARGEQLPLGEGRFDLAICTQVLEYVAQPSALIAEVHRVLKPGGRFLLSAPSAYPMDAEEECWRFLPSGLRHLLSAFSKVEVVAEGSSVTGFFRTVNVCFDIFARYPPARFVYRHSICPLVNLAGVLAEELSGKRNQQFAVNYSVLAEK
jgi:SAM-dependent methyltransferase